jgi:hypothetical protein
MEQVKLGKGDENLNKASLGSDLVAAAFRKIVEDDLSFKISSSEHSREELQNHIGKMRGILGGLDYELTCLNQIVARSKDMHSADMIRYMNTVEVLAEIYAMKIGSRLTMPLIYGLVTKSNTPDALDKYYNITLLDLLSKKEKAEELYATEAKELESLSKELKRYSFLPVRIIRRRRFAEMKDMVSRKNRRVRVISKRKDSYGKMIDKLRKARKQA